MAALAAASGASAQTWVSDSVTMGAGYANDVFYSMHNGAQRTEPNTTWHLAFQVTPQGPYGNVSVLANHVQGNVMVYPLHLSANAKFATLAAADTVGKLSSPVYNSDTSWNYGAFNQMASSNPFGFSWGIYDMGTHNVNGDSVYLIRVGTSNVTDYKVWIKQYVSTPPDSVKWIFRIAKFDGTDDTTMIIRQPLFPNRLFAYYNVQTKATTDREPSKTTWDILFTRYMSPQTQGPVTLNYPVTGVLSNFTTTVADVRNAVPDTTHYQNYVFTRKLSEIGSDWKVYNMTAARYDIDTMTSFFVRSANSQEYWQLQFTGFSSSTGKSVFRKRMVGAIPTAVGSVNNTVANYYVTPVPANNEVSMMIDTKENTDGAALFLTDMSGRTVFNRLITINKGMNAFSVNTASLPAGTYVLSVSGRNIKLSQKIMVAH